MSDISKHHVCLIVSEKPTLMKIGRKMVEVKAMLVYIADPTPAYYSNEILPTLSIHCISYLIPSILKK